MAKNSLFRKFSSYPLMVVIRRFYGRLLRMLLQQSIHRQWHTLAAAVFWLNIHKLPSASPMPGKPRYKLLLLRKAIFDEDAFVSFGACEQVQLYGISRKITKLIAYSFLPSHLNDDRYRSQSPDDDRQKQAYRQFLIQMWSRLRRVIQIDAVLTANFGYRSEQELAAALESLGIPCIALHKENLKTPKIAELYAEACRLYRTPFLGRKIFVYNEIERQAQITGRIVAPEDVIVTGVPRFDTTHQMRRKLATQPSTPASRPTIVFFFFTQTPYPRDWYEGIEWKQLLRQTFQAVVELARSNPECDVIIKTKASRLVHLSVLEPLVQEVQPLPETLQIIRGGDPLQLILQSDVVCSFNSTTILDALALDKPAVVPHFAEAARPEYQPFIVDYEEAVEYAASPQELQTKLLQIAREHRPVRAELPPHVVRILNTWMGNGDGQAAARVRQAVFAELEKEPSMMPNAAKTAS
ncbi:hypothetical protein GF339_16440 [candidate division KSB3 bacterium]|uniref:Uncharacterized protein n=1 Tax=candidate division KSB3 bacterium TaxID=2044937 RepID=A0A9D5JXL1_9BACT|nr:hypothetical protein [candidate division KSB3 bacterium]MBD3326177.1 hypothetical protein [candidate division KSB3 bacterium]